MKKIMVVILFLGIFLLGIGITFYLFPYKKEIDINKFLPGVINTYNVDGVDYLYYEVKNSSAECLKINNATIMVKEFNSDKVIFKKKVKVNKKIKSDEVYKIYFEGLGNFDEYFEKYFVSVNLD